MIIEQMSNIKTLSTYLSRDLQLALEILQHLDLKNLSGKIEVANGRIFGQVSEYHTKPRAEKSAETHVKYIDVQKVLSGQERVYTHKLTQGLNVLEDATASRDAIFYEVYEEDSNVLCEDNFAIYFPWDVHRPSCDLVDGVSQAVKKLVIKVPIG